MRPPPAVSLAQHGVFTSAQALADGWTSHALRHAVACGALRRIRAGVYATPPVPGDPHHVAVANLRQAATAFALTNPAVPVSHTAAGALLGVELLDVPVHVCASFRRGGRGPMSGVHRHRGRLGPWDVGRCGRVALTSAARTVLDIGHEHGADAAITAADSALRLGATDRARLDAVVLATAAWPGIAATHEALALADASAESALESISRLRMARAGLPIPQAQATVLDRRGAFVGRVDFYWDEFGVVGEADGLRKYSSPAALYDEKRRQERLEQAGLIVVRWGWGDLATFDVVARRLRAAFARGSRPDRAVRRWRVRAWPHAGAVS
ncbi:Transcriptional regulator, AbiEi antitoxin, Type IV TA system [Jatrophihabitans endophyticus]|uniref:Transcriptional regulator, AbiEi antitoxin, Type IV TA system n=1 Tax=Jatrophihabitans endophyticus TaxID=1206085 RepID=A0A1M5RND7_9ACTN|nr:type IV toxin-antitoxin system AbiEi family antitoxin domain-containing protein [Jatrophihabitans endophyticus]SHH27794.1 Transcriptional regulator, AbiEi antitoxin, Type IV TA system [Jatrophihabitans endophyticus]